MWGLQVQEREAIIKELWRRIASVSGVAYTARNPKAPPNVSDFPAIQFFELGDSVEDTQKRGTQVAYKRKLDVVVEMFIAATTEASATNELMEIYLPRLKTALYLGGPTLGRLCSFKENGTSRILRPPVGENSIGIGLQLEIRYVEDVNLLFI